MRLREFKEQCKIREIDLVILSGKDGVKEFNIEYFTQSYPLSVCKLLISPKGKDTFLVPLLELERVKKTSKIKVEELNASWTKKVKAKIIGYNAKYLSVDEFKKLHQDFPDSKFIDVSELLEKLREIKTNEEITRMQKACEIGDIIIKRVIANLSKFKTEKHAQRFILEQIAKQGVEPSFTPIVAAGKNAANPHHEPMNTPLKGWCIIDMGVRYKGYCSDMTRTVYIGKPSKEEQATYNNLLRIQEDAVNKIKAGIISCEIDLGIRKALGKDELLFIHGTGHAVGLEIHDTGLGIKKTEKRFLEENMVVTIEPGLYKKNRWGIRIEDTVVVKRTAPLVLTRFTKKLICVKSQKK